MRRLGALLAVLTAAGCGGSPSHTSTTSSRTPAAQVRESWTAFFDPSTAVDEKVKLLQDGQRFRSLIAAQTSSPLAKQTKAEVVGVTLHGASRASVVYSILLRGKPVLERRQGVAVRTNGTWQVGRRSFCGLLALEGQAPPACTDTR